MYKAGTTLGYGLEEVYYGKASKSNIKAFLVYYTVMGYIGRKYTIKLKKLLTQRECMFISNEKDRLAIQEKMVETLKQALDVDNQDELFQKCDTIVIPSWAYRAASFLYESLPAVYLVDQYLYYFETEIGDENRKYLRCATGYFYEDELRFDFYEDGELLFDFDIEMSSKTLSTMYTDIYGYDEDKKALYLKLAYTDDTYAMYCVDDAQTIIYPHPCYGVLQNKYPIIKKDGYLSIVDGNEIIRIRKWDFYEKYRVTDDAKYVIAEPKKYAPKVFKPSMYNARGKRIEMEQMCLAKAVFGEIADETVMAKYLFGEFNEKLDKEKEELDNMEIEVFSLQMLDGFFQSKYVGTGDKDVVEPYVLLIQILSYYLNRDESVLDLFYLLADVSAKLEENTRGFINKKVISRLNELHLSGELETAIQNLDTLREMLLVNAYWNAERMEEYVEEDMNYRGKVGGFEFFDGKIEVCSIEMEDARYRGGQLLMKGNSLDGMVSFDLERGEYEINYNRRLSHKELQAVLKSFRLSRKSYRIIIDGGLYAKN